MPPAGPTDEQRSLLAWGEAVRRDLPWRHSRDPWAVLVSEVMLQQTQALRVVPKWTTFLEQWPTVEAMAGASLPAVLSAWHGLGYPRRAKALLACARVVVTDHGGRFPSDLPALLALPGIGAYTGRALRAFAFEVDGGVVDTNIARVLARRAGRTLTAREVQDRADEFAVPGRAWEHNQSLMDLGAMLCRPAPTCGDCPLVSTCGWASAGWPLPDPAVGSANVSGRQSPFEGSDRQGRGRLLRAASAGPVLVADLADVMAWPDDVARAQRVAAALADEGFLELVEDAYVIAG